MDDLIARLKAANADVARRDGALHDELQEIRHAADLIPEGLAREGLAPEPSPVLEIAGESVDRFQFEQETIVLRTGRPVLAIERNAAKLVFSDPDSEFWKQRLQASESHLERAAQAVGRIEVEGHQLAWLGTGWLVGQDVVVTNRHVALEFGRRNGASFVFRQGLNGRAMDASIDFLEEFGRPESLTFRLESILHIEEADGPDLAFMRVTPTAGQALAAPISLAPEATENEMVAVIGYPARDSRIPDQPLMDKIFGQVYDKKRLAPGHLTELSPAAVRHDCSTLGGNSGSVVLSLETGRAVGIHFAGRFLQANFAVPSTVVGERLEDVLGGTARSRNRTVTRPVERRSAPAATSVQTPAPRGASNKLSYIIPLRVSVEVGDPYPDPGPSAGTWYPVPGAGTAATDTDDEVFTEAVPADYRDRLGYVDTFLGDGASVFLPSIAGDQSDVLTFTVDGRTENVLRYEHFSVMMSQNRRLCLFSAVNIDGRESIRLARTGWRMDPRIPSAAQIRKECYGAPPKFSRGHMTRREDPVWGDREDAERGNADSMHVTNAVPQIQPFNGGIWLDLEDYALQNARQDDMRISVFTGPILTSDDPVMFGVQIPIEFWKVIAFIHDETGELCATGYTMSQQDFLREEEFVFGKHETAQRSIASIEQRTGLSFGPLAALDPFEDLEGFAPRLTSLEQIRFIRGS